MTGPRSMTHPAFSHPKSKSRAMIQATRQTTDIVSWRCLLQRRCQSGPPGGRTKLLEMPASRPRFCPLR
jgi:hypothetical protein